MHPATGSKISFVTVAVKVVRGISATAVFLAALAQLTGCNLRDAFDLKIYSTEKSLDVMHEFDGLQNCGGLMNKVGSRLDRLRTMGSVEEG